MKVKLVKAASIFYDGKVIKKGEIFDMRDGDVKKYKDMVQIIEDTKKKKDKKEGN